MLSSEDEACKLELRSGKISYHSVHRNYFFFQQCCPKKGSKGITLRTSPCIKPFIKKAVFFFREKKILGMVMWRVILGMIMLLLLTYN